MRRKVADKQIQKNRLSDYNRQTDTENRTPSDYNRQTDTEKRTPSDYNPNLADLPKKQGLSKQKLSSL